MNGEDLARQAVACPWWRWLPGMRYQIVNSRGQIGEGLGLGLALRDTNDRQTHRPAIPAHVPNGPPITRADARHMGPPGLAHEREQAPQRCWVVEVGQRDFAFTYNRIERIEVRTAVTRSHPAVAALEAAPRREAS